MKTLVGNGLIILSGILWGLEAIPQIVKSYRTKSTGDLSAWYFAVCILAYACYLSGMFLHSDWFLGLVHTPSLILNSVILGMIFHYGKRN